MEINLTQPMLITCLIAVCIGCTTQIILIIYKIHLYNMKNEYYIGYRDRLGNYKSTWIKAKNPQKAQTIFYKKFRNYELIEKIAVK